MPKLLAQHTGEYHLLVLAHAESEYIYSSERSVKYNLFNPKFDVKWKRVSLDYLCIYQKILHARDMVKSDHDS